MAREKRRQRRKEAYYRRRHFCRTMRDEVRLLKEIPDELNRLRLQRALCDDSDDEFDSLIGEALLAEEVRKLTFYPVEYFIPLPKVSQKGISIRNFPDELCLGTFAFTKPQLLRMREGLLFDDRYSARGYCYSGDEILLAGLYRMHNSTTLGDKGWQDTFGWLQSRATAALLLFKQHIIANWMYLSKTSLVKVLVLFVVELLF